MSPTASILAGSALIAAAIVASAALFLPDRLAGPPPAQQPAPGVSAPAAPGTAAPRYQIMKVEDGASWRLDTQTGELTFCRMDGGRMICASSTQAIELPKPSPDELMAERERAEAERKDRSERGKAMFDRFTAFFERMLKMIERGMEKSAEPEPGDARPL